MHEYVSKFTEFAIVMYIHSILTYLISDKRSEQFENDEIEESYLDTYRMSDLDLQSVHGSVLLLRYSSGINEDDESIFNSKLALSVP